MKAAIEDCAESRAFFKDDTFDVLDAAVIDHENDPEYLYMQQLQF